MKNIRKVGVLVLSSALSYGLFSSVANAQSPIVEQPERIAIEVDSSVSTVSKETLIKKLKTLFPNKFDYLSNNDFYVSNGHYFPEDERIRYDLSFHKTIKGRDLYGSIVFVGDNLELENFHFEPIDVADALFPTKVSKDEAEKIAVDFLKKMTNGTEYELDQNNRDYAYYSNQLITEPVRYEFSFVQKKNNIPVQDQRVQLSVLGNGEIVSFYRYTDNANKATFENANQVLSENEMLQKIKDHLAVSLKYQVNYDYRTGEESVALVYDPSILYGVNAITGDWQTARDFTNVVPTIDNIEKLAAQPLPAKQANITVEEAKKMAEQLLKIDSDKVKLSITSVEEVDYGNGQEVISVQFSYDWSRGGYGSSIEINKETGEIISYHDLKRDVLIENGESPTNKGNLSEQQALEEAINYLEEWVPSYLHNYAKPIDEPYFDETQGIYHFTFPRVVNGIAVVGQQIHVGVGTDGSLNSLNVNHQENLEWPSIENVISNEEAKTKFVDSLSLKLQYLNIGNNSKENHYHLVYTPIFNDEAYSYLDANTGEWNSIYSQSDTPVVTHATAEAELNYLVQNRILEIEDASTFNADQAMTNGEALKILVKSLSYFYEYETPSEEESTQTYANVGPDNPYYATVERAVRLGILESDESFNPEVKLTREQLTVWYIRALGLETAAKNHDIYELSFGDAANVKEEYIGYVALANALKLVSAENNQFNPKGEVTYADIAVSIFNLAQAIHESGNQYH
nr:YcdB/YcdC domain-containing protein [Lysinibacillus timonensis]